MYMGAPPSRSPYHASSAGAYKAARARLIASRTPAALVSVGSRLGHDQSGEAVRALEAELEEESEWWVEREGRPNGKEGGRGGSAWVPRWRKLGEVGTKLRDRGEGRKVGKRSQQLGI